jgi:methylglutaconyl-CoA hydratase
MEQPSITLSIKNRVGIIEFFHPSHNAMPSDLLLKLQETIIQADIEPKIKVIVLKSGGGKTFCAGANFNELIAITNQKQGELFFTGFANVINSMRKCSKIIIGRVQGKAVGGGVGLAAATDYCLATKYASIKLSELTIGIGPFVIEPAVSRKIGLSAFSELTLDANTFFTSDWAKQKGLYNATFDSSEALDYAVNTLVENLSNYNLNALKEMKSIFWKGTENWDSLLAERAKISGKLVLSDVTKETLKRFKK